MAELQQVLSSSDSAPGTTESSLPPDDIQIELEAENAQSFEDYSVGEREAILQILGLDMPSKDVTQREDLQKLEINTDTASHELTELFTFMKRMPLSERKEMRLAVLASIRQDIQKSCSTPKSNVKSAESKVIQMILQVTTKEKS